MMIQLLNYHIIARKCKKDVVQERRNSIDNAPELRFSCTNPSILLLHPLLVFARFLQNLTWECVELSETEARKLCTHHLAEDHIVALCTEKIGRRFSEYTALHMDACMDDILVMKHDNEIDWQLGRQHRDHKSTHVMVNKMSVSAIPRSEGGWFGGFISYRLNHYCYCYCYCHCPCPCHRHRHRHSMKMCLPHRVIRHRHQHRRRCRHHRYLLHPSINLVTMPIVPTSTTRFASDVGYRMAKSLIGVYKENNFYVNSDNQSLNREWRTRYPLTNFATISGLHASVILRPQLTCLVSSTFVGSSDAKLQWSIGRTNCFYPPE